MTLKATPAVATGGAATRKLTAGPGVTVRVPRLAASLARKLPAPP